VNTMVDQLGSFASEVTRVAREVGTEEKLGGQAKVEGVSGIWKDLTDSVNSMADNLTAQVRNITEVTKARKAALGQIALRAENHVRKVNDLLGDHEHPLQRKAGLNPLGRQRGGARCPAF
jgi:hypothetical protein